MTEEEGETQQEKFTAWIISRYCIDCVLCHSFINPGDKMFPIQLPIQAKGEGEGTEILVNKTSNNAKEKRESSSQQAKAPIVWCHLTCEHLFSGLIPPPPTCRHWSKLGRCPSLLLNSCAFSHPEKERGISSSSSLRIWGGKRKVVRNSHKVCAFRIFLLQTFGEDYFRFGTVLDVAGGKGELSWELLNLNNINSILVEPRQSSFDKKEKDWNKGLFSPKRLGPVFSKWNSFVEDDSFISKSRRPEHLRIFFDAKNFFKILAKKNYGEEKQQIADWLLKERRNAQAIKWTEKGLEHDGDENEEEQIVEALDKITTNDDLLPQPHFTRENFKLKSGANEITSISHAQEILTKCRLVVGLHPDQACGDIAEFADSLGLPWCVVPCCTYSNIFTKRKLMDGTRVTTHQQLIQWLVERFPRAKVGKLDSVEGKNVVVYCLPKDDTRGAAEIALDVIG